MNNVLLHKRSSIFTIAALVIVTIQKCESYEVPKFICPKPNGHAIPSMPEAFSCDIRLNFPRPLRSVEIRYFKDGANKREAIEIISPESHVKYIHHDQKQLLINYLNKDSKPSCTTKTSSSLKLEDNNAESNKVLQKIYDALQKKHQFVLSESFVESAVYMKKWEGCFQDVNVSLGFTGTDWAHPITSPSAKDQQYLAYAEAQIKDEYVIALFDNFNPVMPNQEDLQPPEDVYCPEYREDQKPPTVNDYFSYDSELILYLSSDGKISLTSHRSVYYDYPSRLSRVDFYDPLSQSQDNSSVITARDTSMIHDYKSNIQYNFELPNGKCETAPFKVTVDVSEEKETKDSPMPTGDAFFGLNTKRISYNGQFKTRGYLADVYTALVPHLDGTEGKSLYAWYFSSVSAQIVEKDKVENKVLLRMVIQPVNVLGLTGLLGRIDINFYNFEKAEPTALMFDLTSCYNELQSKMFVLTFHANKALRGAEKFLRLPAHLALKDVTGLSKQRIVVTEVNFNKEYMFVEFKLLESPSVLGSNTTQMSLDEAVSKIKKAISDETFKMSVRTDDGVLYLSPVPNGFNEFAGDRKPPGASNYKEGSVIALTIGMLVLGFVLGGITLNLIISRKFGVALFQNSNSGMNRFDNSLNESSM